MGFREERRSVLFSVCGTGFSVEIIGIFLVLVRGNPPIRLYDPAAAHRLVKVHKGLEENSCRLSPGKLRIEKAALRIKHLDVARVAVFKSQTREARVGLQRFDMPRLDIKLFP